MSEFVEPGIELTEALISSINVGKSADVVFNHLKPVLDKLAHNAIEALKSDYRSGKFDPVMAQSKIAELVAYENLETALKAQINKGTKALKNTQG